MQKRKPVIIGNWKMFKTPAESAEVAAKLSSSLGGLRDIDVGIAPTFLALTEVVRRVGDSALIVAAQNCAVEDAGAFTGEVSVPMLKAAGVTHVLVGHSERRQLFGEDDTLIQRKLQKVIEHGLVPVLCIGETLSEREAERTFEVVERQLRVALANLGEDHAARLIVAYEPVWAIGTGRTATTAQAQEVHAFLRKLLGQIWSPEAAERVRLQYGGSVKPDNIAGLMAQPDVDGALVGGASLEAGSFVAILKYERQA